MRADLVRAHDYFAHAKMALRLVEDLTAEGRQGEVRNKVTGTVATLAQVAALSPGYIERELAESVFIRLTSLLEDWVFGLLRIWLSHRPEGIPEKGRKTVTFADVLAARDKEAIVRDVVEREILGVAYRRPADWFAYLNDRVGLASPTAEQVREIAEIKATRDVLAHNQGVVNAIYLEKAGERARFSAGQRAEIPEPYLERGWDPIGAVIDAMASGAVAKAAASARGG